MSEKLKVVFFAAYFLLAPLAGYYLSRHFSDAERAEREIEVYINFHEDPEGQFIPDNVVRIVTDNHAMAEKK